MSGEMRALSPEEIIRIRVQYPQSTRESIAESIRPWLNRATPEEAWRLWNLIDDCLAARQGGIDDERARYRRACEWVIQDGRKPTDEAVAERLGVTARTIRTWRSSGLID